MPERNLHIDSVEVRLPAGCKGLAAALVDGFGAEILHQMAGVTRGRRGALRIERLSIERVVRACGQDANSMRKQMANQVAREVGKRLATQGGEG
jgi:hypothetical protein